MLIPNKRIVCLIFYCMHLFACVETEFFSIVLQIIFPFFSCSVIFSHCLPPISHRVPHIERNELSIGPNIKKTKDMPPGKKNNGILGAVPQKKKTEVSLLLSV